MRKAAMALTPYGIKAITVKQRHHQSGEQTRTLGIQYTATGQTNHWAKQVKALDFLARLGLASPSTLKTRSSSKPNHPIKINR
jgi:hypothetical protein